MGSNSHQFPYLEIVLIKFSSLGYCIIYCISHCIMVKLINIALVLKYSYLNDSWKCYSVPFKVCPQLNEVFGRSIWHKINVWVWAFCSLGVPKICLLRHVNVGMVDYTLSHTGLWFLNVTWKCIALEWSITDLIAHMRRQKQDSRCYRTVASSMALTHLSAVWLSWALKV